MLASFLAIVAAVKKLPLSLLLGLLISGCQTNPPSRPQDISSKPATVGAFGTLVPTGQLRNLSPDNNGVEGSTVVDQLLVREGDHVRSGDTLAIFRGHKDILAERSHLKVIIATNQNRLKEAQDVLERFNRLLRLGAYPLASFQERLILYQSIDNQLRESLLRLDQNSSRLRNSVLSAPLTGVVTRIYTRNGEAISKDGVLQIGNLDQLSAELEVYESDLKRINVGQRSWIRSETGSFSDTVRGRVVEILPGIRERTTLPTTAVPTVDVRVGIVRVAIDQQFVSRLRAFIGTKLIARIETLP